MAAGLGHGPQPAPAAAPAFPAGGPPPLPSQQQAQWYVAVDGRQQGPYELAALPGLVGTGALTRATLVWRTGMPDWLPAEQVPELTQVLATVPPPLPPQA